MKAGRLTQPQVKHIEKVTGRKIAVVLDPIYDTSGSMPTKVHRVKFRGAKMYTNIRER
jgi:hypothetical protein